MEALFAVANATNGTNTTGCSDQPVELTVLYYLLASFNTVVLVMDIWQLARLMGISRETGLKYNGKRLFHWVLGASLLLRAFFFFVSPNLCLVRDYPWVYLYVWLNHATEVLFFFAFFLLLSFWTDLITSLKLVVFARFRSSLTHSLPGVRSFVVVSGFCVCVALS